MKLFRNRLNIWYIKIRMYIELIYFNRICSINSSINGLSSFSDMHKNGLSNTNFYLFFRLTTIYFFKKHVHIRLLYIFLHIFFCTQNSKKIRLLSESPKHYYNATDFLLITLCFLHKFHLSLFLYGLFPIFCTIKKP